MNFVTRINKHVFKSTVRPYGLKSREGLKTGNHKKPDIKWENMPNLIFYESLNGSIDQPHIPSMTDININVLSQKYEFNSMNEIEGRGNLILRKWLNM